MKESRRGILRKASLLTAALTGAGTVSAAGNKQRSWKPNKVYQEGDQVVYDGYVWEAHWWTKGDEPSDTVAVWNRIGSVDGQDGYPAWTPEGVYRAGNRVVHEGYVWEAQWWTEGDDPFECPPWGVWQQIRAVDGTDDGDEADGKESTSDATPVEEHGQLQVIDTDLCDENGDPVQLSGMSTHGLQWFPWGESVTEDSLDALADDWEADILRIAVWIDAGGYEENPEQMTADAKKIADKAIENGMYVIFDWHVTSPGDPMAKRDLAERFFREIASEYGKYDNVLYEICNEPSGVEWSRIVEYADEIIPIIREYDEDGVIIVGTPGWSSLGVSAGSSAQPIVDNPLEFDDVLYSFHFYAASHRDIYRDELRWAAERLPVFTSEWGMVEYDGDGAYDFDSAQQYLDIMDEMNISWVNWNYSDHDESGAVWEPGTRDEDGWTVENLKEGGEWIRDEIRKR
jgi:endoglucanase